MLYVYTAENVDKAFALFQEMETENVQMDSIACSALMRAFNKGNQPAKVLFVVEFMRRKNIPFTDAIFFEMVSACGM